MQVFEKASFVLKIVYERVLGLYLGVRVSFPV